MILRDMRQKYKIKNPVLMDRISQFLMDYVQDFGKQEGDNCFVAEVEEKIVGAVWVCIMDDYGHVEDGVPFFAIFYIFLL